MVLIGGLALVALFTTLILFRRSIIKRKRQIEPIVSSFNQQPFQDLTSGFAPLVPVRREYQSPQAPNAKDRGQDEPRALRQVEIECVSKLRNEKCRILQQGKRAERASHSCTEQYALASRGHAAARGGPAAALDRRLSIGCRPAAPRPAGRRHLRRHLRDFRPRVPTPPPSPTPRVTHLDTSSRPRHLCAPRRLA